MNNRQLAHTWAAQSKASGKGSNFFFEGTRLYSYGMHYLLGNFTDAVDANGSRVVLINARGYSSSTQRHTSYAQQALHGLNVRVFTVPNCDVDARYLHDENLAFFRQQYESAIDKASRARTNAAMYISDAEIAAGNACDYAGAFGLDAPEFDDISPELLERAKEKAKTEKAAADEKVKRAKERHAAEFAERAEKWRAGAEVSLWNYSDQPTMLRVKGDVIETSRGAEVPVTVAGKLWRMVKIARKGEPTAFLRGLHIGNFQLREIKPDGSLIIGCHELQYAELARLADQLGLQS